MICRIWEFLHFVWRENLAGARISVRDAWDLAGYTVKPEVVEMADLEQAAREAFERSRNAMGFGDPTWDELAEETRQVWREFVANKASEVASWMT